VTSHRKQHLARVRKEQLTLGVSDSDSDSDTSDENYEDPKEDDPVDANDTESQDRDENYEDPKKDDPVDANDTQPQDRDDALERAIQRTSQLIEEGQYAMATYETGTSKGKETAESREVR